MSKIDWAEKDREEAKQLTDWLIEKVNADHDDVISFNRDMGCQIRNHIELLRREEKRLRETLRGALEKLERVHNGCEQLPSIREAIEILRTAKAEGRSCRPLAKL